jgi:hypothetical protein
MTPLHAMVCRQYHPNRGDRRKRIWQSAFARADVLSAGGAVILMGFVALAHSALPRGRSAQVVCANQLRQIGIASHNWITDVNEQAVWVPYIPAGGSIGSKFTDDAWYQFSSVTSNYLVTPAILFCPADSGSPASNWSTEARGFLNKAYRANALSYFVGCHADARLPTSVVAGDRNMSVDVVNAACSYGFNAAAQIDDVRFSRVQWTNGIHGATGNILQLAGNVQQLSSSSLKVFLRSQPGDPRVQHLLMPR